MLTTLEEMKSAAARLSQDERELTEYLLSLEPESDEIQQDWRKEIRNRLDEISHGKDPGLPMEQILDRLRERYP